MKLFLFAVVFFFGCFPALAQPQEEESTSIEIFLDSLFREFNSPAHPGIAISVLKDGSVLARKAYGLASIEHNIPFSHNSVVRLPYSEGREFIAIAAVLMETEGLLKLSDKVRSYFPQLPGWSEGVTIRDLINHRSGFVDEWATLLLMYNAMSNRFDKDQFLQLLYRQPKPEVVPGKGYMYSNSDYGLLRLILEKASNESLRTYAKRKIFDPLGMKSTQFHDRYEVPIPNFAVNYIPGANGGYEAWLKDKTSPGGNYYIATTASDLEKWAGAHRDKKSFVAKAVNRLMEDVQLMPGTGKNYVFGFKERAIGKHKVWLHQGVNEACYLAEVPDAGQAVVILGNGGGNLYPFHKSILRYVLNTSEDVAANKTFEYAASNYDRKTLEQYAGRYYSADTVTYQSFTKDLKNLTELIIVNDSLKWKWGNDLISLKYIRPGVFKDSDYDIYLEFIGDEKQPELRAHIYYNHEIENMVKDTRPPRKPAVEDLRKFAGDYYSVHLDFNWRIELNKEGKLVVIRSTIPDTILEPDTDGNFLMWIEQYRGQQFDSYVKFHRGNDGEVTHLTVSHPRLMGHRFDRVK